jgi:hypothetical protein
VDQSKSRQVDSHEVSRNVPSGVLLWLRQAVRYLSIRKEHARYTASSGSIAEVASNTTSPFANLQVHCEWEFSHPPVNENLLPRQKVLLGVLYIHKTISAINLQAVLRSFVKSPSRKPARPSNVNISSVHCLRGGRITHSSPVQAHLDWFADPFSVQFDSNSSSVLQTLSEIIALTTIMGPPGSSPPDELRKVALQQKPFTMVCKGVHPDHLEDFLRCVSV